MKLHVAHAPDRVKGKSCREKKEKVSESVALAGCARLLSSLAFSSTRSSLNGPGGCVHDSGPKTWRPAQTPALSLDLGRPQPQLQGHGGPKVTGGSPCRPQAPPSRGQGGSEVHGLLLPGRMSHPSLDCRRPGPEGRAHVGPEPQLWGRAVREGRRAAPGRWVAQGAGGSVRALGGKWAHSRGAPVRV